MIRLGLLLLIPVALALEYSHAPGVWVFLVSAAAIIPLAGFMGHATEQLATRLGSTIGGLLSSTFGNAAELIIAGAALMQGKTEIVKASIAGSIMANLLLVLGLAIFLGGFRRERQFFNTHSANLMTTMLTLALIALLTPAFFDHAERTFFGVDAQIPDQQFSLAAAFVLISVYLASIFFSLRTHKALLVNEDAEHEHVAEKGWSVKRSVVVLAAATAGIVIMAEGLVGSLEAATSTLGLSEFFVGMILIPLVGNAAENATSITFAMRNKMNLAMQIPIGSSLQIALLVAPVLVIFGAMTGHPMNLVFENPLVIAGLAAAVVAVNSVAGDGETHWLEGIMLLGVYLLLGLAFYFTPH
jgi:Ca2+:H+ antiporter